MGRPMVTTLEERELVQSTARQDPSGSLKDCGAKSEEIASRHLTDKQVAAVLSYTGDGLPQARD